MPSANPNSKLEKQASTEALDPIRQAITVIEHKIRNLEKRKGKLESYRDIVKNGGELNADQKTAVAKYDEVQQTLENMRDLYKQINTIATDAQRQQKKQARIEALERMRQDIAKVREVLLIQDTLMNMGAQGVRQDFIGGVNGAVKLAEEELKFLDDLYNEVMLKHEKQENDVTFLQQAQKVAEHYVLIVDGKQRDVVGTTYAKIKEVISSIVQCGYFDQASEVAVEEATKAVAETHISNAQPSEQVNEEFNERHIPPPPETILPTIQTFPVPVAAIPVVSGATPVASVPLVAQPIPAMQAPVDPSFYTNAATFVAATQQQVQSQQPPQQPQQGPAQRINEVIGPAPNFFFLQDSELDQPPEGNTAQAPPVVSHIPSLPVVAGAVTLNAPIPTQTFTNQTFTGPPVVPPQVMYQHQPPQEMSHMAPFSSANPPPPIPMPQAHQATMQFNQQTQGGFQQEQQQQTFEHMSHQDSLPSHKDEGHDKAQDLANNSGEKDIQIESQNDWGQMSEGANDWSQVEQSPPSSQDQNSQQAWGNRSTGGYRGRGRGRGNSNSYNNRGRGNYQQNGRGSYYNRNNGDGGNQYQNGYQRNNWSNNGGDGSYQPSNGGYKNNFNRNNGQPRGERRDGDRSGMDRGNRNNGGGAGGGGSGTGGAGGQYRGNNPRGANRTNYVPRGNKAQTQN